MKLWKVIRLTAFALALVLSAWGWFGLSSDDEAAARRFDLLAAEWQTSPEFRAVNLAYCDDGSRALAATPFGVRANDVVLALRSLPYLPKDLAVNPTSQLHYKRFAMGPLCAYLHLCTEQDVPTFTRVLEETAVEQPDPTQFGRAFLAAFHMDEPVCADVGAVQSAAQLLRDVAPQQPLPATAPTTRPAMAPFVIREGIDKLLLAHIRDVARELGVPEEVDAMSPEDQRIVFVRLDAHVRAHEPELWRTKQLNDFCCGVWAQVYGPSYGLAIKPVLIVHQVAGFVFAACLVVIAMRIGWAKGRKPSCETDVNRRPPDEVPPNVLREPLDSQNGA